MWMRIMLLNRCTDIVSIIAFPKLLENLHTIYVVTYPNKSLAPYDRERIYGKFCEKCQPFDFCLFFTYYLLYTNFKCRVFLKIHVILNTFNRNLHTVN